MLKRTYPNDETHGVSHASINRSLFIQARSALKKELLQHLLAADRCQGYQGLELR